MKRVFMLFVLVVIMGISACKKHEEVIEVETTYAVTTPLVKDTTIITKYVCQIHSIQNIELRALEKGYLKKIYIDEGQFVRQGQMLFQIMPNLYEAELHKAQADVKAEEIEVLNAKILSDKNVVSKNELALAEAKLDKAKAEVELAKVHLGFTEIRAPFSGILNRLNVRQGSLIDEGDLLTTLSDNSKMWVYFNVPEAEYLNYKTKRTGDDMLKVQLLMANNEMFDQTGYVETIEGEFNHETGNIAFRATFPNPTGLLRHGETGNINVDVPYKNAIIIPQKASFEVLDKKYVFVVNEQNIVKTREIFVAAELPDLYIISQGLKEGEKILLEGLRKVKEDEKIKFAMQAPDKVIGGLRLHAE